MPRAPTRREHDPASSRFAVLEAANEHIFEDFERHRRRRGRRASRRRTAPPATRAAPSRPASTPTRPLLRSPTDVTRLVDEGLVADDWKANATKGIATSLRRGLRACATATPRASRTWDDLVKPGVEIVTPNPGVLRLRPAGTSWRPRATSSATAAPRTTPRRTSTKFFKNIVPLPGQRPGRHHRLHSAAPATCSSPTRTRPSWPRRTARASTTSTRTPRCSSRTPAPSSRTPAPVAQDWLEFVTQRRGARPIRPVRLPADRRRRRLSAARRGRRRPEPTRSPSSGSCSRSTTTSAAGTRLTDEVLRRGEDGTRWHLTEASRQPATRCE